jgi:hypothetical protein
MAHPGRIEVIFRQTIEEFLYLARRAFRALDELPLPRLLLACLVIALMISVIPLAVSLFLIFLGVKLLMGLVFYNVHQQKGNHRDWQMRRQPLMIIADQRY